MASFPWSRQPRSLLMIFLFRRRPGGHAFRTVLRTHGRARASRRRSARCPLSNSRGRLFRHADCEIRAHFLACMAERTALVRSKSRISPLVCFNGLLGTNGYADSAAFTPTGIEMYLRARRFFLGRFGRPRLVPSHGRFISPGMISLVMGHRSGLSVHLTASSRVYLSPDARGIRFSV
jgi:hypothetical protein